MKRLLVLLGAAALALPAAHVAVGSSSKATKTAICHRTTSKKTPYVKLSVSAAQARAHAKHSADIVPAPRSGCPKSVLTATSGGTALSVAMTGEVESPAGDPVGTGTATIRLRAGEGRICFELKADNITLPAAGAHIHSGAAGTAGPIVVSLTAPGTTGTSSGCVAAARTIVAQILANPAAFYVNVHTTDFAAGAIRGQLVGTSTSAFGTVLKLQMSGANERPNPGDPDGTGTAVLRILRATNQICYRLTVQNIVLPAVGAHIHKAPNTAAGGIVVALNAPDASGAVAGCATADAALVADILANPSAYYVNVHSRDFPGGAVRAQLA